MGSISGGIIVRIKVLQHEVNQGNYVARNTGLAIARGRYIAVMDSDDIALPNRLQLQVDFLNSHPKVGCVGALAEMIYENGKPFKLIRYPSSYSKLKTYLFRTMSLSHPTIMLRRKFLEKYKLRYNTRLKYAADYEFLVRCTRFFPIRNLEDIVLKYRMHSQQISSSKRKEQGFFADLVRLQQLKDFNLNPSKSDSALHLKLMKGVYLNDVELHRSIDWLNQLLDANDRLKIFNPNHFYDLLKINLNTVVRKNNLGGWSIEKELLRYINEKFPKKISILEFGSGAGTDALLQFHQVISIEHSSIFAFNRGRSHNCIHSPLINGWYNPEDVKCALELKHDLILVDGPPGNRRSGILNHLSLFHNTKVPVIFDDMDRDNDRAIMEKFCAELNFRFEIIFGKIKSFAYCTKNG